MTFFLATIEGGIRESSTYEAVEIHKCYLYILKDKALQMMLELFASRAQRAARFTVNVHDSISGAARPGAVKQSNGLLIITRWKWAHFHTERLYKF